MTTKQTPSYATPKQYLPMRAPSHVRRARIVYSPVTTPWYSYAIIGASLLIILVLLSGIAYMVYVSM